MVYVRKQVRNNAAVIERPAWWADVAEYFERGETIAATMQALKLTAKQVCYARQQQGLTLAAGAGYNKKKVFERGVENRIARRLEDPVAELEPLSDRSKEGYQGQTARLDIFQLTPETCKFPIDQEAGSHRYCGLATVGTQSWCADHFKRCTGAEYKSGGHFRLGSMMKLGQRAAAKVSA
jgi:hypothetical protein